MPLSSVNERARRWLLTVAAMVALALPACGGRDTDVSDGGGANSEAGPRGDAGDEQLRACTEPGKPCAAHTACAINPVCGNDLLCRPQGYQNCDDGLACTEDICLGQGKCDNKPKADTCALPVRGANGKTEIKCFNKDDRSPDKNCQVCAPDVSPKAWSPANGGACDDGDSCTKDDYCDNGTCRGTDYRSQCADKYGCTDDICDGKGGCVGNKLKADACLINGKCYQDGEGDSSGCNRCDVSKSQNSWTALSAHCLINAKCYKPGEKDSTGCAECDPNKNASGWTPLPNVCQIGGKCYTPGTKNAGGCAECDPATSQTDWTIKNTANCYISGVCYAPAAKDKTGCAQCVPTTSNTQWTPVANTCLIDGKCITGGTQHADGCATCDPTKNTNDWTITDASKCIVNDKCVDNATSVEACGACGVLCGYGETCVGGACQCGSTGGTVGGGAVCGSGLACENGQCTTCTSRNVAALATATSSGGGITTYGTQNMNDGKLEKDSCTFHWVRSSSGTTTPWIQYEWTTPQKIGRVYFDTSGTGNTCSYTTRSLGGGKLQYWSNNAWVDIKTISGETGDWSTTFTPVTTTKIRLYNTTASSSSNPIIYEWEVYCQ